MSDNPKNQVEDLDPHSWRVLSEAVQALEAAWRRKSSPELAEYLIAHPEWLRVCVLKELIKVDQEYAWRNGIRRSLEEYLSHWPEIADSESVCLELLSAECLTRSIFDEAPSLTEIRARFPELVNQLNLSELVIQAEREGTTTSTDLSETANPDSCSTPAHAHLNQEEAEADERIGTSLGRYEIRERLAHGGMGIVYRAWDLQLAREVALKIPKFDPDIADRFLREAQTTASIHHRSVCSVHDYGVTDGTPFLVMPLVEGRSLETTIRKGPLSSSTVAEIASKLARALDCIHDAGLMHRDVSASNVIIDEEQEPVLMDFGLARGPDVTDGERLCSGTPVYMAPETLSREGQPIDLRADIFSLGVLCYQMLTGQLPQGAETKLSDENSHDRIVSPSIINPSVDRRIEAICLRAMANHPAKRYQSAAEFADALDECRNNLENRPWYRSRWKAASFLGLSAAVTILVWQAGWFKGAFETDKVNTNRYNISPASVPSRIADFPRKALDGNGIRAQVEADLERIRMEIETPPSLSKDASDQRVAELRGSLVSLLRDEIPPDLAIDAAAMLAGLPWPTEDESDRDAVFCNRMPREGHQSTLVDSELRTIVSDRIRSIPEIHLAPYGSVIVSGRVEPGSSRNDFRLWIDDSRPFHLRIISLTHGFQTKVIDHWKAGDNTPSNSEATDKNGHRLHRSNAVSSPLDNWHVFRVVRGEDNPLHAEGDYLLFLWQRDPKENN